MKRIVALFGCCLLVHCGGDSGGEAASTDVAPQVSVSGAQMTLYDVFEYDSFFSDCTVSIVNRVLTVYLNEETRQFRVLNVNNAVYREGVYAENEFFSYQEVITSETLDGPISETADCYATIERGCCAETSLQLREVCESPNLSCTVIWKN